ncbi:MAG: hypothetical protein KF805_12940 [Phycisphaeraceae bacterium]|nr:hypothetical protein [Phycisphaeraceae bacterium]
MASVETKTRIKERVWEETRTMLWLFAYIFLFLAALAGYRSILLGRGGAGAWPLLHCAIEAMVLAKVMVIGNMLKLGERVRQRRMFARTISRALAFTLFALMFSAAEELVMGMIRGREFADLWHDLLQLGPRLIVARGVVLFIFFVPLFAIWEIGRRLGDGKLHSMFFDLPDESLAGQKEG